MVRGETKRSGGSFMRRGGGGGGSLCSPASLGIDHVTAPAITSDIPLCFYCTVIPNKIVFEKNSRRSMRGHGMNQICFTHYDQCPPF